MNNKEKDQSTRQLSIHAIRKRLRYGDRSIIAEVVGCSKKLIQKVLIGERGYTKGKGKRVVEVAQKLVELRAEIKEPGLLQQKSLQAALRSHFSDQPEE